MPVSLDIIKRNFNIWGAQQERCCPNQARAGFMYGESHLQATPWLIEAWETVAPTSVSYQPGFKAPRLGWCFHEPWQYTASTCPLVPVVAVVVPWLISFLCIYAFPNEITIKIKMLTVNCPPGISGNIISVPFTQCYMVYDQAWLE